MMRAVHLVLALVLALFLAAPALAAGTDAGRAVFADDPRAVIRIDDGRGVLRIAPRGERWYVTGPDGRERLAAGRQVAALRDTLAAAATAWPVAGRARLPEDAFARTLRIEWGARRAEYGGPSRVPGLVYLRLEDGSVHLAPPPPGLPDAARLVDRRLFPDGLPEMAAVNVSGPRGLLHVTRKFGVWRLTVPSLSEADDAAVDGWIRAVAALSGDPVAMPPAASGTEATLLTASGADLRLTLWDGDVVAMDGEAYRVDPSKVPLLPERFRWMDKRILRVRPAEITGVQVQQAEKTLVFSRGDAADWVERASGHAYKAWMADLFRLLDPLTAVGVRDPDAGDLGEAQVEVRLWRDQSVQATVELWMGGSGRWWARGGEDVTVYEISGALPRHLAHLF
ncbi:MAG: hypothetical protein HZA24_01195 [Nitrospirae bacterium]|nr:hypothetical protein [Nitrospirota bacterium]